VAAVALLALLPLACGGSSGGGGVVNPPTSCVFFGDGVPATSGEVVSQSGGSTCSEVAVELMITDVSEVFAIDFTVNYDPGLFTFEGVDTAGSLLTSDGASVSVLEGDPDGSVLVGVARLNPAAGVSASGGTFRLLTLRFGRNANSGNGAVTFTNPKVLDSGDLTATPPRPPTPVPNIDWSGGTLRIE